jgi:hypothetical protein
MDDGTRTNWIGLLHEKRCFHNISTALMFGIYWRDRIELVISVVFRALLACMRTVLFL